MNGIALLLMAATMGVEYDWQPLDDGQIEYSLIVEPDFISPLAEGSEIRSSVPDVLESVQRLRIRIAQPAKNGVAPESQPRKLPPDAFRSSRIGLRAAEPMTILWKALGQPEETTLVRYGWQPTKEGQLEYFVQIDPKLLRTLAPGDEIYATLSAEAGRIDTFVVFSNAKPLPKVAGKPAAAPRPANNLGTNNLATNPPPASAPFTPAPFTAPNAFNPAAPAPANPTSFGPPTAPPLTSSGFNSPAFGPPPTAPPLNPAPPRSFGGIYDDAVQDTNPGSRINPATGYGPAQPAATDNVRGYQWENNRNDLPRPNLNSPNAGLNPPANQPFQNEGYGPNGQHNPQQPYSNPPASDLYANNPNGALRPNGPQLPSAGNAPYRPNVGYPQDNHVANQGYNNQGLNNQGFNNNQPPIPPNPQAVGYGPMNDNQVASLPNNNPNGLRGGLGNDVRNTGVNGTNAAQPPVVAKPQPWWPMVFVTFFLFVSLGGNLYLIWTAMEFYSRYRLAVERLRTSGTRG